MLAQTDRRGVRAVGNVLSFEGKKARQTNLDLASIKLLSCALCLLHAAFLPAVARDSSFLAGPALVAHETGTSDNQARSTIGWTLQRKEGNAEACDNFS